MDAIHYLLPYQASPTLIALTAVAAVLFGRGQLAARRAGEPAGLWRGLSFWLGLAVTYAVLQTPIDYLAQHMFWVHRAQHLVLHHIGPILMVLAVPHEVMARGLPAGPRERWLRPLWHHPLVHGPYRVLQNPLVASVLFAGIIYLWLYPPIHFAAMLSVTYYNAMNWSVLFEGLLFWWLILDPRSPANGGLSYGVRMLMLWGVMPPQILIGAYIGLNGDILFDVYNICGRVWDVSPLVDQQIGGLLTWIPASMMSALTALIVLRMWLRESERGPAAAGTEARA
ncbi:MAG TPA: cytochrome c oxidase assembly protein [Gammaproteobacteria bacterium]|nr:cytochrome c oxidase assembly protein [Gammaproteobacteria bacterium]